MTKHSFICNACEYFISPIMEELGMKECEKCKKCNGRGSEWQPKDKEAYEKDPIKYMRQVILALR